MEGTISLRAFFGRDMLNANNRGEGKTEAWGCIQIAAAEGIVDCRRSISSLVCVCVGRYFACFTKQYTKVLYAINHNFL